MEFNLHIQVNFQLYLSNLDLGKFWTIECISEFI